MQKFAPDELIRRIDEVLFYMWDPIGVSPSPHARREYSSYADTILNILKAEKDPNSIKKYLDELESGMMGLPIEGQKNLEVAKLILLHEEAINDGHA